MAELLKAPDVASMVITLLAANMPVPNGELAAPVTRAVPNPRPQRHITVLLTPGSGRSSSNPVIERQMVTVECWGDRHQWAADLATDAHALIHAMKGAVVANTQIYKVTDVSGPGDLPDPISGQPRVTFTVQLMVRIR